MWQPYTPADTSSFTAYNSQSGLTTAPYTNHSNPSDPLSPYSSIINSSPPSLSPLTLSFTPHMIKDILRGTPGFPEEELEEEREDDCPTWLPHHLLLQGRPPGSPGQHLAQAPGADQGAHHLVHLLNPLSLLLPNTCFSSSTGLPTR